ncbi:MAG TPA: DUF3572 family protein [Allosphingosinicella sp.]|jgi:hypothetical protein
MTIQETNEAEPASLALAALGWILSDDARAERLLSLTGLTPDDLRTGLGQPATLAAILAFLEGHEPDLVACAEAIGASPAALVDARRKLERA